MMKEIISVMILLMLCAPVLAADIPNMVGNWIGTAHGVGYLKNTDYQTTGKPDYWDDNYTIVITEQNGTRFSGKAILDANPLNSVVVLGIIGSNNKTINMVDDAGYYWGSLNSSTEMELFGQAVDIDSMSMGTAIFTKE